MSRFGVGWVSGAIVMALYYEQRPHWPFWVFVMIAIATSVLVGHLAEKYLAK